MIREKTPDYILDEYDAQEFIYLLQLKTPQEKLLYARARIGVSQKDIANYMKVHQVTVSRIEKDPLANQELLYKYCEAVEVDKSWIESRSIGRPFDYSLE
ncbi:helix-turn-helix domain-containing protein, partial [Vibrio parahaemolyticus]